MKRARTATKTMHRARPAAQENGNKPKSDEEKMEYIDFINKLMHRMRMDSIERMLDAALKETDRSDKNAGG